MMLILCLDWSGGRWRGKVLPTNVETWRPNAQPSGVTGRGDFRGGTGAA
ncbi:MAG: hypothetical protein KJZ87_28920 [Thermoguttaceae bacterium]|nr:hypothetical protein [Thermoguttaceae bacterium]